MLGEHSRAYRVVCREVDQVSLLLYSMRGIVAMWA